jgi:hypothetical protein
MANSVGLTPPISRNSAPLVAAYTISALLKPFGRLLLQIGAAYALNLTFARLSDRAIRKSSGYLHKHTLYLNSAGGLLSAGSSQIISLVVAIVLAVGGNENFKKVLPEVFQRLLVCGSMYWQFNRILSALSHGANIQTPDEAKNALISLGASRIELPRENLCFGDKAALIQTYITLNKRAHRLGLLVSSHRRADALICTIASELVSNGNIANEKHLETLRGKEIYRLNLHKQVTCPGSFAERVDLIIAALRATKGQLIIYIDDIYSALGAPDYSDTSGKETFHFFKGELQKLVRECPEICILGSITEEERTWIQRDESCQVENFDLICINPASQSEVLEALENKRDAHKYDTEIFNNEALKKIYFASQYVSGENPEKSINLMHRIEAIFRMEELVLVKKTKNESASREPKASAFDRAIEIAKQALPQDMTSLYS